MFDVTTRPPLDVLWVCYSFVYSVSGGILFTLINIYASLSHIVCWRRTWLSVICRWTLAVFATCTCIGYCHHVTSAFSLTAADSMSEDFFQWLWRAVQWLLLCAHSDHWILFRSVQLANRLVWRLCLGFLLDKKVGVNQPKRVENARILIANTQMDTDKIKVR